MYPIPPHEYRKRLSAVRRMPDYRRLTTRERGRPVVEHWGDGCCQLRAVVYPDGWEPWGRKGVPGYARKEPAQGKIAFTYFGNPFARP